MKINIRRGASQIGGSAVEITATSGARIVLDLGIPLDADINTPDLLPDIRGLRDKTDDLLAVLISHAHADHYGLGNWLDKLIPVYISGAADRIIRAQCEYLDKCEIKAFSFENTVHMEHKKTFDIGPFKITPYLVDHAAYESMAFLVEADGQKVFYTGDFRAHGRTAGRTYALMKNPPRDVDVMLMEGSSLERLNRDERFETESALEEKFLKICRETPGLVMVHQSSQNIDRLVTVFRAAVKAGRTLVLKSYTGRILMVIGNDKLPNFTWKNVKKITPDPKKSHEISAAQIAENPGKYVCIIGGNTQMLEEAGLLNENSSYVYSMWAGYKNDFAKPVIERMTAHGVAMHEVHTSGHADIPTLRAMAAAVRPRVLVPIHTFSPDKFADLFGDICPTQMHADNTEFEIQPTKCETMKTTETTTDKSKKKVSDQSRILSARFMYDLGDKNGILTPILAAVKAGPELSLQIRDNYINVYYRGGNLIKISQNKTGYTGIMSHGFGYHKTKDRPDAATVTNAKSNYTNRIQTLADAQAVAASFPARMDAMYKHYAGGGDAEKAFQHDIAATHTGGDFIIVDTEYQVPGKLADIMFGEHMPRIDMIAISPIGGGAYRPILVENKWGDNCIKGKCGLAHHTKDYCGLIKSTSGIWEWFLNKVAAQAKQLAQLGLLDLPEYFYLDPDRAEVLFVLGNKTYIADKDRVAIKKQTAGQRGWSKIPIGIKFFGKDVAPKLDGNSDKRIQ